MPPRHAAPTCRSEDEILAELRSIKAATDENQAALDRLYERRVDVFREARSDDREAKIVQRKLAEAAGVSEVMVIQAIRKAEEQEART